MIVEERDTMCTGPHDFIPAAEVAKAELRFTMLGEQTSSVFYFSKDGGFSLTDLATLGASLASWWNTDGNDLFHAGTTLREVVCTDVSVEDGAQVSTSVNTPGTRSGNAMPNNVCLCVSFRTGFTGRSNRGRVYHSGLVEGDVTDNNVITATATLLRDEYEDLFQLMLVEAEAQHVIVSYCNDGAWRTDARVTPVTSYIIVDTVVDSQRRRLPGRGS